MNNYAGRNNVDDELAAELQEAGIQVHFLECLRDSNRSEVKTAITGELYKWGFTRAWRYWVAEGPGIPPEAAERLHAEIGHEVRVDGHCGAPGPFEWHKGFAVGLYHVDSQAGLNALARTIREVHAAGKARLAERDGHQGLACPPTAQDIAGRIGELIAKACPQGLAGKQLRIEAWPDGDHHKLWLDVRPAQVEVKP